MKERILEFLKRENKSSAQFADEIGVQPSGISHILSGRNNPSLDFVLKMLEKYKYLSTDWLLFGKGDMYKEAEMRSLFELNAEPNDIKVVEPLINSSSEKKEEEKHSANELSVQNSTGIERIVCFYRNSTFREYLPE